MKEPANHGRRGDRYGYHLILHRCPPFLHLRSSPAQSDGGRGYKDTLGCGVAQQVEPCNYDAALQKFGDSAANSDTNLELGHSHFQNRPIAVKIGKSPISVRSVTANRTYPFASGARMAARQKKKKKKKKKKKEKKEKKEKRKERREKKKKKKPGPRRLGYAGTIAGCFEFKSHRQSVSGHRTAIGRRPMRHEIALIIVLWLALQVPLGSFVGDCMRLGQQ